MKLLPSITSGLCASLALAFGIANAPAAYADGFTYKRHNLVSDGFVPADHYDAHLVNAWGIAFNPFGAVWVSNNGTGTSTLYDGTGNVLSLVVQIPSPTKDNGGNPTGMVYNGSSDFVISKGAVSAPSRFVFATEDGVIAAWAPSVDLTHAVRVVPVSSAIFKGLAISAGGSGGQLYATDFFNAKVRVYDSHFMPVTLPAGAFQDADIPHGFAPFGIQNIGGDIYVTYAKQAAGRHDDVHGPGLGYVDAYTPNGRLIRRVATRGALNAPWGMAVAPAGFGRFGSSLLIGNFGDGRINAYDPIFNFPLGSLRNARLQPIHIPGLWGLAFGNGYASQSVDTLYFTAGPGEEAHGLYGRIEPTQY
ncbi:MAG: TIGR03118 family protein [Pseudomonadota bacterium]|nr:TIGR03118 family protein [Pseudomonadota bacterium]